LLAAVYCREFLSSRGNGALCPQAATSVWADTGEGTSIRARALLDDVAQVAVKKFSKELEGQVSLVRGPLGEVIGIDSG
jgi:hypothetical protein